VRRHGTRGRTAPSNDHFRPCLVLRAGPNAFRNARTAAELRRWYDVYRPRRRGRPKIPFSCCVAFRLAYLPDASKSSSGIAKMVPSAIELRDEEDMTGFRKEAMRPKGVLLVSKRVRVHQLDAHNERASGWCTGHCSTPSANLGQHSCMCEGAAKPAQGKGKGKTKSGRVAVLRPDRAAVARRRRRR